MVCHSSRGKVLHNPNQSTRPSLFFLLHTHRSSLELFVLMSLGMLSQWDTFGGTPWDGGGVLCRGYLMKWNKWDIKSVSGEKSWFKYSEILYLVLDFQSTYRVVYTSQSLYISVAFAFQFTCLKLGQTYEKETKTKVSSILLSSSLPHAAVITASMCNKSSGYLATVALYHLS